MLVFDARFVSQQKKPVLHKIRIFAGFAASRNWPRSSMDRIEVS